MAMTGSISAEVGRIGVVAAALLTLGAQAPAEKHYLAVEANGVLCGYVIYLTSPIQQDGRTLTRLTHEVVIRGTLLGGAVNNRILLTYHIDPDTKAFTYHESLLEQGSTRLTSAIRIQGRTALVSDGAGGKEAVVELPANVVLDNTLFHPHLVADFVGGKAETRTYLLFDGRDNAVRETSYTRKGNEKVQLAGRSFDTVVLESIDRRTGLISTLWLDSRTGMAVQTRQTGGSRTYLTDPSVVEAVNRAGSKPDLNPSVLAKTNLAIPNVRGIAAMTVRATARPAGFWVTPESLNVPGQRFSGTVKDNLIDGVFEIAHARYDGTKAPPFPPVFGKDSALTRWLGADEFIQTDDPVLGEKAREITRGSRDSWEAARRLSRWVATEIKGAIPGGVTARGTFDQRAGECGGHSYLMAALARSVGIPARAVLGVMYAPLDGGVFGRHAWNEVYMGEAGWIPLDTTIGETDYVDSGHIRLGVPQSLALGLDVDAIEILAHRISEAPAPQPAAGAVDLGAYVGEYTNVEGGNVAKVAERNGSFTLDIPGQVVLMFKAADAEGVWRSAVSDDVFITFDRGDGGAVVAMRLHQSIRLPRAGPPTSPMDAVPAELRAYPGAYLLQQAQAQFMVVYENSTLVINDPLAKRAIKLKPAGRPGAWIDEFGKYTVRFATDVAGSVNAMLLEGATVFQR
jgi:transglutaminase-like putative cysteine protease